MSSLLTGKVIGEYEIQQELGCGAFGVSFLGVRTDTRGAAVLKRVHAALTSNSRIAERIRAQAVSPPRLSYAGIARLETILFEANDCWLVQEYVEGESPQEYRKQRGYSDPLVILPAFAALLDSVAAAHRAGYVHANIKPSNVRLRPSGEIVLLDFAASRIFGFSRQPRELLGTPPYRAPELAGEDEIDGRADLHSLGVVLRELLEARTLPSGLDTLISKATATAPGDRYRNAGEFAHALRQWIKGQEEFAPVAPPALETAPDRQSRRWTPMAWMAAGGLLAAIGVFAWAIGLFAWMGGSAPRQQVAAVVTAAPAVVVEKPANPPAPVTPEPAPVETPVAEVKPEAPPSRPEPKAFVWRRQQTQSITQPVVPAPGEPAIAPGSGIEASPPLQTPVLNAPPPPPPAVAPRTEPVPPAAPPVTPRDTPPVLLRNPAPRYPALARQSRVSGTVRLELRISAEGKVTRVRPIHGHALLVDAAVAAVQAWQYRPAIAGGRATEATTQVDVVFDSPERK
ncbi:MAG: TonB family protein [Bryobacteraceae bacterium]|nr:TonB family protein [Bryobacteraceae bacterium]